MRYDASIESASTVSLVGLPIIFLQSDSKC